MTGIDGERLRYFVLARFCCPGASTARKQLARYVSPHLSAPAWRETFEATVADLTERGWIQGASATDQGRRALSAYLRLTELPEPLAWKDMTTCLLARALDRLPDPAERRRLDNPDRLRGTTLASVHDLDLDNPSVVRAVDALIWRELGVDSTEPLSLAGVRRAVLSRLFDTPATMPWTKQAARGAAAAVGASSAAGLRDGILRAWLGNQRLTPPRESAPTRARPSEPPEGAPPPREALRAFAETVLRVAKNPSIPRLGRRVYISALYANIDVPMSLDDFKQALGDAHRAGLVQLERAEDGPYQHAQSSDILTASETHYLHTVFHFLVVPEE